MPVAWTSELDIKLLLACIEHHNITPNWAGIAPMLGPNFTTEAVRQHFKKIRLAHQVATATEAGGDAKVSTEKGDPTPAKKTRPQSNIDNVRAKKRKYKNVDDEEEEDLDEAADEDQSAMKTPSRAAKPSSKRARSVRYSVPDVEEDEDEE